MSTHVVPGFTFVGRGPGCVNPGGGWPRRADLAYVCERCGVAMPADHADYFSCACGAMSLDFDSGRFGSSGGDQSILVYVRTPHGEPRADRRVTRIEVETTIAAPLERCFDLARDLDLHVRSLGHTGERAVAGRTTGLIELHEEVTWEARHFGLLHRHTSRITAFDRPRHFRDSMTRGRFARFEHDHFFAPAAAGTHMRDVVEFASPCGPIGRLVDRFVLARYLTRLLQRRNAVVKAEAEAERASC